MGGPQPPPPSPGSPHGDSIRVRSALLFNETPLYASQYTTSKISCTSCHAEGGESSPYASPMVGLPALFPMYNERAGHMISMKDRIQECFVRSENGTPLSYTGPEMQALVDYITWLFAAATRTAAPSSTATRPRQAAQPLRPIPSMARKSTPAQCSARLPRTPMARARLPQFSRLCGDRSRSTTAPA